MNERLLQQQRQLTIDRISALIPRHSLNRHLTPLLPAQQLSNQFADTELWIKRDDLISFGLGGNKIRGLEVLLADALTLKADTLITGAGVQSNHVRATAAVAAYAGLRCLAIYWGQPPKEIDGNYRLTKLLNAQTRFTGDNDRSSVDAMIEQVAEQQRRRNYRPYAIPRGGACALGALGHVLAVFELYQQCLTLQMQPDTVVLAVGSGGTYAGWLLGIRLLKLPWKLRCYSVSREPTQVSQQVAQLANAAAQQIQSDYCFNADDAPVNGDFIGAGYGIPSREAAEAIERVAKAEGILLDPTYTGKAMAGLLHDLKAKKFNEDDRLVFLHSGGEPAFFSGDGAWLTPDNPTAEDCLPP